MKATCVVFYGKDIIKTTPAGEVDIEASKRRLSELASHGDPELCEVLFDLRGATPGLTAAHLDELAGEMGRIDSLFVGRIALLFEEQEPDLAVASSPDGRYQVAHFVDFDEAMAWLSAESGCAPATQDAS